MQTVIQISFILFFLFGAVVMIWQWRALRSRDREMAALRRCNILVHDYQVPEPLVDAETPVLVQVHKKVLLVQPLNVRQLGDYHSRFALFLAKHAAHVDALDALLNGQQTEKLSSLLSGQELVNDALDLLQHTLLKNAASNPDKITKRYLAKHWTVDHMFRILYALWQFNSGEFYKKKLQAVQAAVTGHMLKDFSPRVKRSDSHPENTYQSPFRDSPFYPAHLRKSQSGKDKSSTNSEKKEA